MKSRGIALVITALVLWGVFFSAMGEVLACQIAMPGDCPMRSAHVVKVVKAAPSEEHACCAAKNRLYLTATPGNTTTLTNTCCCVFRASNSATDQPVVLVVAESPVFLPSVQSVLTISPFVASVVIHHFVSGSDVPRGPPPTTLSPRAPPAFS